MKSKDYVRMYIECMKVLVLADILNKYMILLYAFSEQATHNLIISFQFCSCLLIFKIVTLHQSAIKIATNRLFSKLAKRIT